MSQKLKDFIKKAEAHEYYSDWFLDDAGDDIYEDDGTLHVVRHGRRYCFDVSNGQSDSGYTQNKKTYDVIVDLGLLTSYDPKRVYVEEEEYEEEEVCPHCGR